MVMDAAVTIPQTKQLAYRPNSTSSSPVSAIIQQPGPRLRVKVTTMRHKASAKLFHNHFYNCGAYSLQRSLSRCLIRNKVNE